MPSFLELSLIVKINKQFDRSRQRFVTAGETPRRTSQTRQVMTQVGVAAFDRISLTLVFEHCMIAPVTKILIHQKAVRVIVFRLRREVYK